MSLAASPPTSRRRTARPPLSRTGFGAAALLGVLALSFAVSCRREAGAGIVRLIDRLDAAGVLESPLRGLDSRFAAVRDRVDGANLLRIRDGGRPAWLMPTSAPLLAPDASARPERATLTRAGKVVAYSERPVPGEWSWRRLGPESAVEIKPSYLRSVDLAPGDRVEREFLAAGGAAVLRIDAERIGPAAKVQALPLALELNGKPLPEIPGGPKRRHEIAADVAPGLNRMVVSVRDVASTPAKGAPSAAVRVFGITVHESRDRVVIAAPENAAPAAGESFDLDFAGMPDGGDDLSLYRLRRFALSDTGVGENPETVKLKLKIDSESLNVLFAPGRTSLSIPARVPPGAVLEFGYGHYIGTFDRQGSTRFRVTARSGERATTLFEDSLPFPASGPQRWVRRRVVNLAPFAGRDVAFGLETESRGGELLPAFWINPVIAPAALPESSPVPADAPVNVVLVSLDTVRASHLTPYGYDRDTSPALNDLAKDGVVFADMFSHAPYTLSSHMSLLTGLLPVHHGVLQLDDTLDPSSATAADLFRSRGWLTAAITGGGQISSGYGFAKGFDSYDDWPGRESNERAAEAVWSRASAWLGQNRGRPFFLFLHSFQAHEPYETPEPWNEKYLAADAEWKKASLYKILGSEGLYKDLGPNALRNLRDLYDAEIRYQDEFLVKPLVEGLKRMGLYDRTLIVITSDHGEEFREHGAWGHGHGLYDEQTRVPLVIKLPGSRDRGRRVEATVGSVDVLPTMLDVAGIRVKDLRGDGRSLAAAADGGGFEERAMAGFLPSEFNVDIPERMSVVRGRFKLIRNLPSPAAAAEFYRPAPPERDPLELYDLAADPGETRNVLAREGKTARELLAIMDALRKDLDAAVSRKWTVDPELRERLRALGYIH